MTKIILKIVPHQLWAEAESTGTFVGAPVDLADGFIHFSTPEQVQETAMKHFAGQNDLLIVTFDADQLGDDLKWEVSRGGALFPHLYRTLTVEEALKVQKLPLAPNGLHQFPESYE